MTRNDIIAGDILVLSNAHTFRVIRTNGILKIMNPTSFIANLDLNDVCNLNLSNVQGYAHIVEIQRNGNVIWNKPVEMTIADIEKALGITKGNLRIKV